ncbi:MAG: hypothetical protein WC863_00585 [Patescibacteria group bacterium]
MKFRSHKKYLILLVGLLVISGVFVFGHLTSASTTWAEDVISGILGIFVWALGGILSLVIKALLAVAQYQEFIKVPVVEKGWVIVRDLCNMFFVVVLMVISFGTILHLEEYSYKKWLPKLVLMAVLINFSKTICGLLIDVSQVVMLTFVNAFKDIGGGNATEMLGITSIVTASQGNLESAFNTAGAYVLGIIYLLVAIVVFGTMAMMLVMRLVIIWIYVVLSPFAYLMSAFPGGQKYASQWWDEFIKNLIVGPVLAFFIWLSLAALQTGNNITVDDNGVFGTAGSTTAALVKFIVAIGMLVGGLTTAQQIGGKAGSIAGKGMAKLQKGAAFAGGLATGAATGLKKWTGNRLGDIRDVTSEAIGVDLNVAAAWKRRNEQAEANRQLRLQRIRKGTLETATGEMRPDGTRPGWLHRKAALASTGDVAWQNLADKKFGIFKAGSPKVAEEALAKIREAEEGKAEAQTDIEDMNGQSSRITTVAEHQADLGRAKELEASNIKLDNDKRAIVESKEYIGLEQKHKDGLLTKKEQESLDEKRSVIEGIDAKIEENDKEITSIQQPTVTLEQGQKESVTIKQLRENNTSLNKKKSDIVDSKVYQDLETKEKKKTLTIAERKTLKEKRDEVAAADAQLETNNKEIETLSSHRILVDDDAKREDVRRGLATAISSKESKLEDFDKEIFKQTEILQENKLSETETSRAHVDSTIEAEANKKIATFTNPDQLVAIFKEAIKAKDQGLIAATYKKLTKTGNYNDVHRALGIGTGYDGMITMSKYLQEEGGFSQQDSRGLIAEVGEIAKSVNHYEAFGAMTMNKAGQWEETGKDQQEASILGEKSKMQVQQFVRNVNRLGQGSYRNGQPHTDSNWELSRSTIALYASKDEKYAEEMSKTGNINSIQFIGANAENIQRLRDAGAKQVADVIERIMKKAKNINVADPLNAIREVS